MYLDEEIIKKIEAITQTYYKKQNNQLSNETLNLIINNLVTKFENLEQEFKEFKEFSKKSEERVKREVYVKVENDARRFIRDFMNEENSIEEVINYFDLKMCDRCDNYELREDLISNSCGEFCETCINDF